MQAGREIKFRAWYEKESRMIGWNEMKDDEDLLYMLENKISDVSPVMQYTGLRDKNGKEIYEGDILGGLSDGPVFVSWDDKYALFQVSTRINHDIGTMQCGKFEVIGNIYENPELLEVGK